MKHQQSQGYSIVGYKWVKDIPPDYEISQEENVIRSKQI